MISAFSRIVINAVADPGRERIHQRADDTRHDGRRPRGGQAAARDERDARTQEQPEQQGAGHSAEP
ncbi:hypothetical protein KTE23_00510 [Burkholderia multivorans]|uniref:hypothetical protein n=1 Tax=Burkholderia multivorans TaxID=87883 RepID=UPI001C24735A|nr:hypothetical protein [Burkholderia multivorans]MBU9415054.1 hypothetical protein [Burkholderia multivorans]MBU9480973.1 hypothetical protein [Burkholderia multivorans]